MELSVPERYNFHHFKRTCIHILISFQQDEEAIAPKNGSVPHQNNGGKTFPLSTSTVSKPPSSQPIIENATARYGMMMSFYMKSSNIFQYFLAYKL